VTARRAFHRFGVLLLVLYPLLGAVGLAFSATTELVSMSSTREAGNLDSYGPAVSADGRYVAFQSQASNLVLGDSILGWSDVFVRDRSLATTDRVSVSTDEVPGNGASGGVSMSADGRFVAFSSTASNLVPGDTNAHRDVFVRDRFLGTTERVSVSSTGEQGDGSSIKASISVDGRFVALCTDATNLAPGDTNGKQDVFLRDRLAGTTELVSLSSAGEQGNNHSIVPSDALSADGRYVAFLSCATNLTLQGSNGNNHVYVRDRLTGVTECIDDPNAGGVYVSAVINADGRYVALASDASTLVANDTNGTWDVFVCDRETRSLARVSLSSAGDQANGESRYLAMSADGRYVVFCSLATNLVSQDTSVSRDVFIRDRQTGTTERVSVTSAGEQADGNSGTWGHGPSVSADGRFVAYQSWATNLVPGDTNVRIDAFLRDRDGLFDVVLGYWAYRHVLACFHAGIVAGYADGSYQPLVPVTRAQMAVYIARAFAGGEGAVPPGPDSASFPDVPPDHWAYDHIEFAHLHYIVQGYPEGTYQPDETVTRAQMAVYVARSIVDPTGDEGLIGYEPPPTPTFADVLADFWAHNYVEFCHDQNIVQGYEDGYHPDDVVTRDQMAVYIARAFELPI